MELELSISDLAKLSAKAHRVGGPVPKGYRFLRTSALHETGMHVEMWQAPNGQTVYAFLGTDPDADLGSDEALARGDVRDAVKAALAFVEANPPENGSAPVIAGHAFSGYEAQYVALKLQNSCVVTFCARPIEIDPVVMGL